MSFPSKWLYKNFGATCISLTDFTNCTGSRFHERLCFRWRS